MSAELWLRTDWLDVCAFHKLDPESVQARTLTFGDYNQLVEKYHRAPLAEMSKEALVDEVVRLRAADRAPEMDSVPISDEPESPNDLIPNGDFFTIKDTVESGGKRYALPPDLPGGTEPAGGLTEMQSDYLLEVLMGDGEHRRMGGECYSTHSAVAERLHQRMALLRQSAPRAESGGLTKIQASHLMDIIKGDDDKGLMPESYLAYSTHAKELRRVKFLAEQRLQKYHTKHNEEGGLTKHQADHLLAFLKGEEVDAAANGPCHSEHIDAAHALLTKGLTSGQSHRMQLQARNLRLAAKLEEMCAAREKEKRKTEGMLRNIESSIIKGSRTDVVLRNGLTEPPTRQVHYGVDVAIGDDRAGMATFRVPEHGKSEQAVSPILKDMYHSLTNMHYPDAENDGRTGGNWLTRAEHIVLVGMLSRQSVYTHAGIDEILAQVSPGEIRENISPLRVVQLMASLNRMIDGDSPGDKVLRGLLERLVGRDAKTLAAPDPGQASGTGGESLRDRIKAIMAPVVKQQSAVHTKVSHADMDAPELLRIVAEPRELSPTMAAVAESIRNNPAISDRFATVALAKE